MSLFCGIDIGSTNIKVLLIDEDGRTAWVRSAPSPRIHDGIGPVTDGLQLVATLEDLIISGWRDVGGGKPIAAISSAGIGEDGFCLDDTLRPLGHAIPWFDKRDRAEATELGSSSAAKRYPAINFAFATTAAKWLWLSRNRSEELVTDRPWVTLADFPLAWWAATPFISATLLPRTGVYNVFSRDTIPELVELSHAPLLPPTKIAGQVVGMIERGKMLASGAVSRQTVCIAGGHDHPIASSAIMRLNPRARIDSIGTANAMLGETETPTAEAARAGIDLSVPVRGGPGISALGPIEFSVPLLKAFGSEENVRKLLSVKHILGTPAEQPPLINNAVAAQNLRRLLEALSWEAHLFLARMNRVGVADGPIYATGGWARSLSLMELRASIFGTSIATIHEPELTALGAALFAAEAVHGKAPAFERYREVGQIDPHPEWLAAYARWR
jgi:xylulokinase